MKKIVLFFAMIWIYIQANADNPQINAILGDKLKSTKAIRCTATLKCSSPFLSQFYENRHYSLAWIKDGELTPSGIALAKAIENAYVDGLDPRTYHVAQIDEMVDLLHAKTANSATLVNLDLTLTDGLFLYLNNLIYGWQDGKKLYPQWPIARKKVDLQKVADKVSQTDDINQILIDVAPKYPGYASLREKLADYYKVARNGGWETIPNGDVLKKGARGDRVLLLQKRLYITGELSELDNRGKFNDDLEQAVIQYQENNGLNEDGIVSGKTLNSLNLSVEKRIKQIELNMDRMRFLPDNYPERYVWVNIPDYSLEAIEDGRLALFSAVVVGKPNHKTCILNSQISTIELNPYWNIPLSIVKEILPDIRSDHNYLKDTGIKIFRVGKDNQYTEINPKSINWKGPESNIFSLKFREDPGEDNALGQFKFIFANNCGIYLHDSLAQAAFEETRRGLSHGCIRVGEVVAFANYLLKINPDWDNKRLDTAINSGTNKFVKLSSPTPLYIIYLTAWYDGETDFVQFRDDVYNYDKLSKYPLYLPNNKS